MSCLRRLTGRMTIRSWHAYVVEMIGTTRVRGRHLAIRNSTQIVWRIHLEMRSSRSSVFLQISSISAIQANLSLESAKGGNRPEE